MKRLSTLILISTLGLSGIAMAKPATALTYKFTEAQLQKRLSAMMPITRQQAMITVTVSDPKLKLISKENLIQVDAKLDATLLSGIPADGTVRVTGSIDYNRDKGTFHYKNPKVVKMHINQLPQNLQGTVKNLAENAIIDNLKKQALFKIKDKEQQKLLKAVLKSISVKDKALLITLDMNKPVVRSNQ